jgi:hypothetical protein
MKASASALRSLSWNGDGSIELNSPSMFLTIKSMRPRGGSADASLIMISWTRAGTGLVNEAAPG